MKWRIMHGVTMIQIYIYIYMCSVCMSGPFTCREPSCTHYTLGYWHRTNNIITVNYIYTHCVLGCAFYLMFLLLLLLYNGKFIFGNVFRNWRKLFFNASIPKSRKIKCNPFGPISTKYPDSGCHHCHRSWFRNQPHILL